MSEVYKSILRASGTVIAIAAAVSFTSAASADTDVIPNLQIDWQAGAYQTSFLAQDKGIAVNNKNGTFSYFGSVKNTPGEPKWNLGWSMTVNPDPFVIANIVVTNNSAFTQTFTLTVTLPIGAIVPASLTGGSVTGTVTDLNGDGATVSAPAAGGPIYMSKIDGNDYISLLNAGSSASAGSFLSNVIGPDSFGGPVIPSLLGPAVNATIGITLQFDLTAGDSASFTSIFVVEPIPGPAGLALLGVAGLVGVGRRRRTA
jgi:hypothetical protein